MNNVNKDYKLQLNCIPKDQRLSMKTKAVVGQKPPQWTTPFLFVFV